MPLNQYMLSYTRQKGIHSISFSTFPHHAATPIISGCLTTVPCLVGVGVGLPSLLPSTACPLIVLPILLTGLTRLPTKPFRFRPVLPRPSQFSFSCRLSSSSFCCGPSPDCTEHSTHRHCSIRPTVSVTCLLSVSEGRAAGGLEKDWNATSCAGLLPVDKLLVALLLAPELTVPSSVLD